jgi:hypothetical protein
MKEGMPYGCLPRQGQGFARWTQSVHDLDAIATCMNCIKYVF